ncbi:PREDICTED: probable serine/threonine-protein kinase clkA [Ceratosolen solmsi marchali]|uniref:Probable serine/threonine-protein kinase clkA n=1 Tax=Ceratosolen solmsi marchali TaxID=326594 RepID=A0AAJ6VM43_9HYME|nr:PREDICTED: probable serine/threonine-protein kinase clkA [Ceratosolen solmsi marchali]
MTASRRLFILTLVVIVWNCVFGLQRPPPRYSQQYMPQTSFTCRNKIIGSYYADPETDCQLFHVCVSVAGSIQDYRFLCPNDTAFDQESQTCADWYDVDCEAATLYYASDNFDLYRIGSGLESLHYDSIRSDFEPQDHLQRSESNDPIRSPLNSYNSNNYKEPETQKKSNARANENSNHHTARNQKQLNSEIEKNSNQEPEKKVNLRKINRKPINNGLTSKSTTITPVSTQNRYNEKSFGQNFGYSTTSLHPSTQVFLTTQKSIQVTSTPRPTSKYTATSVKSTANSQEAYTNYQTTTTKTNFHNHFNNFNRFETTSKPTSSISTNYPESQSYSGQFSQGTPSTTKQPSLEYHANNYEQRTYNNYDNNYSNKNNNNYYHNSNNNNNNANNNNNNYNNNQRTNSSSYSKNAYDNYNSNNNNNNYNSNAYTANTYAPTTYSPGTKKFINNRQFYDKSSTLTTKSTYYTETDSTKVSKKINHQKGYDNYETSTKSFDISRSSIGLGFSPSSVNHLAENFRSTTPTPRRAAFPTTYNPNSFNVNTHAPQNQVTQQKSTYHQNQSTKQYSTTLKVFDETTTHSKLTKKNDYDYAYYDNGNVEYDNIELEHVSNNKDSVKIT